MLLATLGPARRAHGPVLLRRQPVPGRRHRDGRSARRPAAARPSSRTCRPWPTAFTSSGAQAACICSSDALYAEYGEAAAAALKAAGRPVRRAGGPAGRPARGLPARRRRRLRLRRLRRRRRPDRRPGRERSVRDDPGFQRDRARRPGRRAGPSSQPDDAQWRRGVAAGDRQGRRRGGLGDARGHRGQAAVHGRRPGRASTSWTPIPASRRTCAARTRRCT